MRRRLAIALAAFSLAACGTSPPNADTNDLSAAARGLDYARASCAQCHAVERRETQSPNPGARTFADIANTPGMTGMALNAWLHSAHPSMPQIIVPQSQVTDLAAYLRSLAQPNTSS